jgi:hypothetical protein
MFPFWPPFLAFLVFLLLDLVDYRDNEELIAGLCDDCRRTMAGEQEFPKLHLDMLIRAFNEELDVFDHFEHCTSSIQRLRSYSRAITIVNTIVPPLEDFFVTIIHTFP